MYVFLPEWFPKQVFSFALLTALVCIGFGCGDDTQPLECEPGTAGPYCEPCEAGTYCPGGTAEAMACEEGTWDGGDPATACQPWTDCGDNEFVAQEGTRTTDRHCEPCPSGAVSAGPNAPSCEFPPEIDGVDDGVVCTTSNSFLVLGAYFMDGATVEVTSTEDGTSVEVLSALVADDGDRIEVTLDGFPQPGEYTVAVINPDGYEDSAYGVLSVAEGPSLLLGSDPPVAYQGIRTPLHLYVANVNSGEAVARVRLIDESNAAATELSFEYDPLLAPHRIDAEIPANQLDAGSYKIHLEDSQGCPDAFVGSLSIEDQLTVDVDSVEPSATWRLVDTTVEIEGQGFEGIPRIYLSPQAGGLAHTLSSIGVQSPQRLTAVIPQGLPSGSYDVVVVNGDGAVGITEQPLWVVDDASAPPRIDDVTPRRIRYFSDQPVTIAGDHFREGLEVTYECLLPDEETPFIVAAPDVNVLGDQEVEATFPVSSENLPVGTRCVVMVSQSAEVNGTAQTEVTDEFSVIRAVDIGDRLRIAEEGPALNFPRRGLVALPGRATTGDRYLYAIGGEDELGNAQSVIETARLDRFGEIDDQGWVAQRRPVRLPSPESDGWQEWSLTMAGAAHVGRFVFMSGGSDGTWARNEVLRAQVLDPEAAPRIDDVDLQVLDSSEPGLEPGAWVYRISAVFAFDDLVNPGGESLPSDPIVLRVPELPGGDGDASAHLALSWEYVDRALGYRVYRSPYGDAPSGSETLVAEVTETSFLDTGEFVDPDPDKICEPGLYDTCPLKLGALGDWAVVANLPDTGDNLGERNAPCTQTATDPDDEEISYLYTAFGQDDSGGRNTISIIPLDNISDDIQVVDVPRLSASTTDTDPQARWDCGSWRIDDWVYFGPGRIGTDDTTNTLVAGRVVGQMECSTIWQSCVDDCEDSVCEQACDEALDLCETTFAPGELVCADSIEDLDEPCLYSTSSSLSNSLAGYSVATTDHHLFVIGGGRFDWNLSHRVHSAEVVGPPELGLWTVSGDITLPQGRRHMGSAEESGAFFFLGGEVEVSQGIMEVTGSTWVTY